MKKIVGKKRFDHGDELSLLLQQMAKSIDHIRGNHLWFYFQSVIPRPAEQSQKDGENSTNKEIISQIEKGIEKISQRTVHLIKDLENSGDISDVRKQINGLEEMILKLKHWLEAGCSNSDKDLKQQAGVVLQPVEDLSIQLAKLSELEKKTKDRPKQKEKDTPNASRLQSDLKSETFQVKKLRESLSSLGLTIDEAMDPNNILDTMATTPRFLQAVRDRLAAREKSSNSPRRKLSLDSLLTWTDMPSENDSETRLSSEIDTSLQASSEEGFLRALTTQLDVKYHALAQSQRVLNHKLRLAQEEKRLLEFQLDKAESNISELKVKLADLKKDWKMLDDFRSLAETYKKPK